MPRSLKVKRKKNKGLQDCKPRSVNPMDHVNNCEAAAANFIWGWSPKAPRMSQPTPREG